MNRTNGAVTDELRIAYRCHTDAIPMAYIMSSHVLPTSCAIGDEVRVMRPNCARPLSLARADNAVRIQRIFREGSTRASALSETGQAGLYQRFLHATQDNRQHLGCPASRGFALISRNRKGANRLSIFYWSAKRANVQLAFKGAEWAGPGTLRVVAVTLPRITKCRLTWGGSTCPMLSHKPQCWAEQTSR